MIELNNELLNKIKKNSNRRFSKKDMEILLTINYEKNRTVLVNSIVFWLFLKLINRAGKPQSQELKKEVCFINNAYYLKSYTKEEEKYL